MIKIKSNEEAWKLLEPKLITCGYGCGFKTNSPFHMANHMIFTHGNSEDK